MSTVNQVSGKGLAFPIILENGSPRMAEGWELIKSCIWNILAFEYGKRYFQRDFGANLERLLEEPNDLVTAAQLEHKLNEQLTQWENRVSIRSLDVVRDLGTMTITVKVALRNSNPVQTETFDYII